MEASVFPLIRPQKGRLERVAVDQVEFAPHYDARSRLLSLLHGEGAVFEAKHVDVLAEKPVQKKAECWQKERWRIHLQGKHFIFVSV